MKIKKLEIAGFKSFADRVTLDFQQPVTGVVGPNGCGKSNIVDAIRWCMGEQSAKHLRGKAMEDVIFAGSETRKPLGMAEVSLTFTTDDGRAPAKYLEYAEIQLTRRLYRDGESDYLINKTPCRLLDITELFMDTGVGTRAYSIIEQGKIGQILHSRPEERRFLIEEAAGVTKFKARKQVALKKIDGTRQNLTRLADILGEIKRQLASLQRQAKKAEKFREYRDELREIELLSAARDYRNLFKERQGAASDAEQLTTVLVQQEAALATAESEGEAAKCALLETEKQLAAAQEEIYRLKSTFSGEENRQQFQQKERDALGSRLAKLSAESEQLEIRLKETVARHELLQLRSQASSTDTGTLAATLQQQETALSEQQEQENRLIRQLDTSRKELFGRMSEIARNKSVLENGRKRQMQLQERLQRSERETAQLAERLVAAETRQSSIEAELQQNSSDHERNSAELARLRGEESILSQRLPELEKQWQTRRDELNRSSSRLHSLKELEAQFAGFGQGVRTLIKEPRYRDRLQGVLADGIQAPSELEAAVEAVLADRLQALVMEADDNVIDIIEYLRNRQGGRVTLALVDRARNSSSIELPEGAVLLAEEIQYNGAAAAFLRTLLASALLVDTLPRALTLAAHYPELTIVTRQGDLVTEGGIVTGGSAEQLQSGLIHKKREIRELEAVVARMEQELHSITAEREQLRAQSAEVAGLLKEANSRLHQSELKRTGLNKDRQQSTDEIARIKERQEVQRGETGSMTEELQQLEQESASASAVIADAEASVREKEQEVAALNSELERHRAALNAGREQVSATRVQVATVREQHEAQQRELSSLQRQITELSSRSQGIQEELAQGTAEQERLREVIAASSALLAELLTTQNRAEQELQATKIRFEQAVTVTAAQDAAVKQLRDDVDTARNRHAALALQLSTLSMQAELAEQALRDKHRISMAEALARLDSHDFNPEQYMQRRQELQRLLDEMGEVNLMAIDEYAAMEERFTFLTAQKDDLEESLKGLQQAIQKINRTTRQRFQETFELVNAKFKEVFPRLFCGGCAELRLTNEEDLLETGIDIIVQPPGKKLQNVTLLSGGEKALTAVALIFSIFLIKPTPFCLLDEVDAPLDDANIGRFNEMVREMSSVSQFIIITHNKATMHVADTLYGITMEEPGASKTVSVRLH